MIDVREQINDVARAIGNRVLEAGEARVATITQSYNSPIEEVWDACTNPDRIPRWFLPISGDLRIGGRYQLQGNANGIVERCDAPNSFAATWEFGGGVSWIEVTLSPTSQGGTLFTLDHIAQVDDDIWAQFGPGAVGIGWDMALLGLATHLTTRETIDPAEIMAWMASAECKEFMAASSERWCAASIEAGTDPDTARAAAERTTAAYTAPAQ